MSDHGTLTPRPAPDDGESAGTTGTTGTTGTRGAASPATGPQGANGNRAKLERLQRVALDAHSDMEAYRRVLAAAVANEKNALARTEESLREAASVRGELSAAALARGIAEGRVNELERERATLEARTELLEHELVEVREGATADLRRTMEQLDGARSRIAFLEAQLEAVREERRGFSFTALRLRSRVLLVGAVACYLLSLGFFVQMVLAMLASNVPPLKLLAVTLVLFLVGVLAHTRAAHELADEADHVNA